MPSNMQQAIVLIFCIISIYYYYYYVFVQCHPCVWIFALLEALVEIKMDSTRCESSHGIKVPTNLIICWICKAK